ncbi:hypothetical protein H8E50_11350 [bacterium]|nr:hypothetical protein [bacterium]
MQQFTVPEGAGVFNIAEPYEDFIRGLHILGGCIEGSAARAIRVPW